jgi:hypothetical protein
LYNFKCYKAEGGWKAVLIDFDLSSLLEDGTREHGATSKHRTGTTPFMARNLLQTAPPGVIVDHLYAYEVESWLYILLHVFLGYTDIAPPGHPLEAWTDSNWEKVYDKKHLFFNLHEGSFLAYLPKVRCCF